MQKLKYNLVEDKLINLGLKVFTANDLCQIFGAGKRASEAFLSYNAIKTNLIRLKKGFYAFKRNLPHDFLIANKIYTPSYVSLDSALSFYGLIPETVYAITSVTSRKTNSFLVESKQFVYHKIKKEAFTGYAVQKVGGETAYLALPEKAVADFYYFVFLKKRSLYERLSMKDLDKDKLKKYLKMLKGERLISFWRNTIK